MRRARRGERLPPTIEADSITMLYRGLDGVDRATRLHFEPAPQSLAAGSATFELDMEPHGRTAIFLQVTCAPEGAPTYRPRAAFLDAYVRSKRTLRAIATRSAAISARNEEFQETVQRARQRPAHADHPETHRAVSLRRHSLVQHRLRPRRADHRPADSRVRPGVDARRARLPRAGAGDRVRPPSARPNPARSCTKCAAARWRRCGRCRSAATTAASTPRRCS